MDLLLSLKDKKVLLISNDEDVRETLALNVTLYDNVNEETIDIIIIYKCLYYLSNIRGIINKHLPNLSELGKVIVVDYYIDNVTEELYSSALYNNIEEYYVSKYSCTPTLISLVNVLDIVSDVGDLIDVHVDGDLFVCVMSPF